MKNEYSRAIAVSSTFLCVFYLAMSFGLSVVFDGNVARLLAATAIRSVAVFLLALPVRLPYRRAFWSGSSFAGVMMVFAIPSFIVLSMLSMISANAISGALALFPHRAGSAAALAGALQFGMGAL